MTGGAASPLRPGGIEFVSMGEQGDSLLLGQSTLAKRLGVDVVSTLASSSGSDLPTPKWLRLKQA